MSNILNTIRVTHVSQSNEVVFFLLLVTICQTRMKLNDECIDSSWIIRQNYSSFALWKLYLIIILKICISFKLVLKDIKEPT
jgi:hypothetical protein